ncbi:C5a anaphylatoxin chemotactic receptor 1-like [Thalassophryne amazonica]|uniref:C5a anaphylatoxin chemotactic receptor 1-like n=1 Tax=Thalassophryne amazonica TaxID=390379 RepID=UPI00147221E7|nr:C5a anaphylatoxin chemotactic receptor 1-like [Thalassophryne amazonica]
MRLSNGTGFVSGGVPPSVVFDSPEDYFIFIFHLLFATCAFLFAGSVVVGISATRALHLQNRFIFMLNTSIADTLIGLSVYYLGLFDVQEGYPSRNSTYHVLPALLGINILVFLFAQFDRYFAVCHPFLYARFVSRQLVIAVNIYCWIHCYIQVILLNLLPTSTAIDLYVFSVVVLQFVVLTKVVMTVKLYLVARYQVDREPPSADKENKKESLRIIIFVVVSFLVLWSPSFVNIILRLLFRRGLTFRNEATNPFAIMARLNAVCTPAVYMRGSPALREAVIRTVWARVCPPWRTS